ncbi:FMN-dependent NADH-azoreductase [Mycoplasma phocoeninasale]|uniref:FMN dependent NADH:quinone oxidoreductase n=1 Tax=Mycoplasma phocoeninasale TaxID=2726117 RepID=A0A858U4A0_9MOLU|nr:FMN-dependent NADH-azoreductase [Mycoplasma phocoeninasale]MBN0970663.1 FMN-dependent NADH-azoreductase [Mycoplasma phocoeninasale]QJG66227.1 FMN-dependent NADH-azoreductase [Mycoplasma phocoeninasale]
MAKIIVIYGSPIEEENSISTMLTKRYVEEYQKTHPEDEFQEINLNDLHMSTSLLTSKNRGIFFNKDDSDYYIELLKGVDKVIMNSPMINFNVPATVKTFFDRIAVADKTFSYKYSKKGDAIGLLDNLKVQIIATQGAPLGWYPWASHVNYLEGIWKFLGAEVSETILLAGVKASPLKSYTMAELLEEKLAEIIKKAQAF